MKKKILLAGLLFGGLYAQAQCEAVAILQQNFNEFTTGMGTFPQECWTASAGTPMMYIDGNEEETENLLRLRCIIECYLVLTACNALKKPIHLGHAQ